jgi:hypothetical protein
MKDQLDHVLLVFPVRHVLCQTVPYLYLQVKLPILDLHDLIPPPIEQGLLVVENSTSHPESIESSDLIGVNNEVVPPKESLSCSVVHSLLYEAEQLFPGLVMDFRL